MFIDKAKQASFTPFNFKQWQEEAEKTLKGRAIESLYTQTIEGIELAPLYTKEDLESIKVDQFPGTGSNVRGFVRNKSANEWRIAQELTIGNWYDLKNELAAGINMGQETISFNVDELADLSHLCFTELNKIVDRNNIPLFLLMKSNFPKVAKKLLQSPVKDLTGVVGKDLLSSHLDKGNLFNRNGRQENEWLDAIVALDKKYESIKTIIIDATPYQASGANAMQELGIAISEAVFYIEIMRKKGWDPVKTIGKMAFHFAVGSHFFTEIAKFRVFKKLWKTIVDAYEITADKSEVIISAKTSSFTKTYIESDINIIRSGNEAFAAVLGGIDFLHVGPFDEQSVEFSSFSNRVARNTQLLLREEAHLNKVIDPAGGSFYVESLTNELVQKAWEFFQEIDRRGGIYDVLESDWLQQKITDSMKLRRELIVTRKNTLIGVNNYVHLDSHPSSSKNMKSATHIKVEDMIKVSPIKPERLAEAFESLRKRAINLERQGRKPSAGLICLGSLKDYKPRADFATSFLAAGGIYTEWSSDCDSLDDIKKFIIGAQKKYYCFCGIDEKLIIETIKWLKQQNLNYILDIAGKYDKTQLLSLGVNGSIYSGQNMKDKLDSLLTIWEGAEHDEA